ncbi:MAG: hypothetical protein ACK4IY_05420, partial [Chitinophagales bacterium]
AAPYFVIQLSVFIILLLIIPFSAIAQTISVEDTAAHYLIRTNDGNEFTGLVTHRDLQIIVIQTESYGQITIPLNIIKHIKIVKPTEIVNGEVWPENPQATRYFWAPNGYGINQGEIYYQNIWILFNQFSFGITDYFSVSAGVIPLFLFAGTSTPAWVVPKFSIPLVENKLHIGAGALAGAIIGETDTGFGILFGNVTYGSRNKNLTLGVGYGFADGQLAEAPVINLSFFSRIGKNGYLLSENYFLYINNETLGLISFGGRSIIRRTGIDYGLAIPVGSEIDIFAIPILGITLPLGK